MFKKVLIANRGAIACRIIRTLKALRIGAVAVYSEADRDSLHVAAADEAWCIGPAPAAQSYLNVGRILEVARACGAGAIHPGYGFLSENADFAERCEAAGIRFIGPTPPQIRDFGLKHTARALAAAEGVPLLPGSGLLDDAAHAAREATRIGYPVMLKSTAGGGGIGMQLCQDAAQLAEAFASVSRLAQNNFSEGGLFLEKYIAAARHIEVQLFGDGRGRVVALGERDCSLQRRNQKVIEETPAPGISEDTRRALAAAAVRLGRAVNYRSAGTVEFIYDVTSGGFYFLEVNTRLQVEHGVTEAVTGIDLVEWMIRVAADEPPDLAGYVHAPRGAAIQARVYAEDPARGFRPASGQLAEVRWPPGLRVDTWVESGVEVPPNYDPMLAKLISHGATREAALAGLARALADTRLYGIETNLRYLRTLLAQEFVRAGTPTTRALAELRFAANGVEVLAAGTHTTIQDWPGRLGFWEVGVPPSGPMDHFAFRFANRLVGNPEGAAALEITAAGPTLRFHEDSLVALAGAALPAEIDGTLLEPWRATPVRAGATLRLGAIAGAGLRSYLAVRGGFDGAQYLGSRATFTLGGFGGHAGRELRAGDVLHFAYAHAGLPCAADPALVPVLGTHWTLRVLEGPHAAPDFFTPEDIAMFYATNWRVHYNSSRTGVRLIGPKPQWARADGGEAGLHPSNIHDNAYAIGSIDFTGDMPVILGPDGPSLGGFVCPATIVQADLWQVGQLRPGDTLRFRRVSHAEATAALIAQDRALAELRPPPAAMSGARAATTLARNRSDAVLARQGARDGHPGICYRQAGEDNLLIEYGPLQLDLELRCRVHLLAEALRARALAGVIDLTPGIRSLQVHYDPRLLQRDVLLALLHEAEAQLPANDAIEVPSRIVHLPLSWDDPATRLAIERYMQSVRADAPWCPSNIEFIRRINGLNSIEDVRRIVFEASYLVLGLGDVYLGAPVATPLDPRHRLVTTKYNPARTWTPENAVGIGGAYLCVYGMEGPGGYQFVGRTLQMWSRHRSTADFPGTQRWLLRHFDQLRFFLVSADELLAIRADFPRARYRLRTEEAVFRLHDYRSFLEREHASIAAFKARQQAAFEAERERWRAAGTAVAVESDADAAPETSAAELPAGCAALSSPVAGSVWQINVAAGARVAAGDALLVIESMKMEIPLVAETGGEIVELRCARGRTVAAGELLLVIRSS